MKADLKDMLQKAGPWATATSYLFFVGGSKWLGWLPAVPEGSELEFVGAGAVFLTPLVQYIRTKVPVKKS